MINIKALPYRVKNFLKYTVSSLSEQRGSGLFILLILTLYLTWSFKVLYIKFQITIQYYWIERVESNIKNSEMKLKILKENLKCYQNQLNRISKNKEIDLNYCIKKD